MDMNKLEREYHTEKRIADNALLQRARAYYDMYADSRNTSFVDMASLIISGIILCEMHYDVEHMQTLFELARLYAGKGF